MSCNVSRYSGQLPKDLSLSNLSSQKAVVCNLSALTANFEVLQEELNAITMQTALTREVITLPYDGVSTGTVFNLTPPAADVVIYQLENPVSAVAGGMEFNVVDTSNANIGDLLMIMVNTTSTGQVSVQSNTNLWRSGCGARVNVEPFGSDFRYVAPYRFDGEWFVSTGDNC
jgi:hypothetical protein